jgi:putative colanic acid biosynthesis acetyltransferase WcaF
MNLRRSAPDEVDASGGGSLKGMEHGGPSFSLWHRATRAIWGVTWLLLASWTPPQMGAWRCFLLRLFGAKIGKYSDVRGSARVWYPANLVLEDHTILAERVNCYNMALVKVGAWSIISQRATLCGGTHDVDRRDFKLIVKPIMLEPYCWVASEAFVGPGVTMCEGSVLGARGVAFRDLLPWTVYAGNPAQRIRERKKFAISD